MPRLLRLAILLTAGAVLAGAMPGTGARAAPMATLEVDAREAPRGIERVHLTLPVRSGKLTLLYPKWLPGEHAPNGPIGGVSGLHFSANGRDLGWQRDAENMFAFHLVVPAGLASLDVRFEVDAVPDAGYNNAQRTSTESLAIILWNQLVFYPAGVQSDDLEIRAALRLPADWQFGTALPGARVEGGSVEFQPVSLTTLIDSPLLAGRYFRTVDLGGSPAVSLHLAADSPAAIQIPDSTTVHLRKLVAEAAALFGAVHYGDYHFLLTLSDRIGFEGIEHHQSSDNRTAERVLIDEAVRHDRFANTLLPHEYVHSWNGKFRRPAGLATGNYDAPMHGDLLWVYEGLTEYLGMVLSERSGLADPADARDAWADVAAWLGTRRGRDWRPLADTAIGAPLSYTQAREWQSRTRGADFYDESAMLWLEADTLIRAKSGGAKSLDDFVRLFYGPPSTAPKVVPYAFADVMQALNTVLPYDWQGFWTERLNRVRAEPPLEGLTAAGWHLTFADQPSAEQKAEAALFKISSYAYSLGFGLRDEGATITSVLPASPADLAGITPDATLIAVDGRKYSKDALQDALAPRSAEPRTIELLIEKDELFKTYPLNYAGGARFPRLERDAAAVDYLAAIGAPRTH